MTHVDHNFEIMETQDHSPELGHVQPFKTYLIIFISLLILTVITVAASYLDFGAFDLVVAMVIASVKAMLVVLFFMHLKYENTFTWIYAVIPVVILFLLLGGMFLDNPTRNDFEMTGAALNHSAEKAEKGASDH